MLQACAGESCRNSNKVLATYGADENLYKIELGKLLKENQIINPHYYFEELRENYGDTILVAKLKAEKLCAIVQTKVKSWQGIEELRKTLGHNYKGAELINFKIRMSDSLVIPIFYCDGAAALKK